MAVAPRLDITRAPDGSILPCDVVEPESLRKVPLFGALTDDAAERLCSLLVLREFRAPTRLFNAGDVGDAMYLIDRGRVRITVMDADGREVTLSELHEGEFFGEMALIDGHERSAGATVMEDARLVMLTRADFLDFVTADSQVMLGMLVAMAGRLRRTDNLLRHRVSRNANTEQEAHITMADRAADWIARFGGSWTFIAVFLVSLGLWMAANAWLLYNRAFDPYPFIFLNLVLAMITSLQAPIIMMSQNRQSSRDRLRSDLDYEVNLKNELLLTEIRSLLHEQRRKRDSSSRMSSP
jgi:uncharacterized membrane protein